MVDGLVSVDSVIAISQKVREEWNSTLYIVIGLKYTVLLPSVSRSEKNGTVLWT